MPPKKPPVKANAPVRASAGPARKSNVRPAPVTANKKQPAPVNKKQVPTGKTPVKAAPKKAEKKGPTPEDLAAIKIQKYVRRYLAAKNLQKLRKRKKDYEDEIEKIQRDAFVSMVKAEQEAAEREYAREEEERRRKKEETKRRTRMLEAAFEGEVDEMKNILNEVKKMDDEAGVINDEIGRVIRRSHQMAVINCQDPNDNTPLSEAAAGGSVEAILFLIERGADVNSIGAWGRSPLYRASFAGHLESIETLLQYGADPRIYAHDGNNPEQVSSVEAIVDILKNWDIQITESLLEKMEQEKERRFEDERMKNEAQTNKLQNELNDIKKEYDNTQKILETSYAELEKRIKEHDKCMLEGSDLTKVTLLAVQDAEGELEIAKLYADKARSKLEQARLKLREQQHAGEDDSFPGVNCNIRELEEVLLRDVGNKIKDSEKWPMLIDPTGQATTFLRYRDTNYICAVNPQQMKLDVIRVALLGAIRFGKPFVLDMLEVDMYDTIEHIFEEILPNLLPDIISKELLQDEKYMQLIKESDSESYQKSKFQHHNVDKFMFILVTKNKYPAEKLLDIMYPIRIILPEKK